MNDVLVDKSRDFTIGYGTDINKVLGTELAIKNFTLKINCDEIITCNCEIAMTKEQITRLSMELLKVSQNNKSNYLQL